MSRYRIRVENTTTGEVLYETEVTGISQLTAEALLGTAWNDYAAHRPGRGLVAKLFADGLEIQSIDDEDEEE